jgi:hypothetical protein
MWLTGNIFVVPNSRDCKLNISTAKVKPVAFQGAKQIRIKIVIECQIAKQANDFNYLGYFLYLKTRI